MNETILCIIITVSYAIMKICGIKLYFIIEHKVQNNLPVVGKTMNISLGHAINSYLRKNILQKRYQLREFELFL